MTTSTLPQSGVRLLAHPSLKTTTTRPRHYQIDDALFLQSKKHAMLTSRPGIGKTLPAIMAASTPALILCPTYLTEQWVDVLHDERPSARVTLLAGEREKRKTLMLAALSPKTRADYVVANIEMMRSYQFPPKYFQTLIIDESHYCRGRKSLQAKGVWKLAQSTEYVFELTGTPVQRTVDDLFMQLAILDPKTFKSYGRFLEDYCKTKLTPYGVVVTGVSNPRALQATLAQYARGHTYDEVGLDLPKLISIDVPVKLEPKTMRAYKDTKETYRAADLTTLESATAVANELRQMIVCAEKITALKSLLEDAHNRDDYSGSVVFCWYRATAHLLGSVLNWPIIDGEIDPVKRASIAKRNENVVATLASLSEGVDLSNKKLCVFFESDYLPGRIDQAISRMQRWSPNKNADVPVRAYFLIARGTIDEQIRKAVRGRVSDIRKIMQAEMAS